MNWSPEPSAPACTGVATVVFANTAITEILLAYGRLVGMAVVQERIAKVHFFRLLTSRSGSLKTARLCLGCLINVLIISESDNLTHNPIVLVLL